MESVFAAVFGWIILREQLTWIQISGCVLILAAIIFSQVLVMKQNKHVMPESIPQ
jgi:drug/metabolite transporter (DMT)-like permease